MRQPRETRRHRFPGNMPIAADRHQPGRQQKLAGPDTRPERRHLRHIGRDDLFLAPRRIGQRDQIDLDDAADRRKGFGRHDGQRARNLRVIPVPHIEEVRQILDPRQIHLRLHRAFERRPRRFQCRLQLVLDQEFGLLPDLDPRPGRMLGHMRPRVEALPGVVRHLPGDKHKIVAHDRRHKARSRRRGDARRVDLADLVTGAGGHRDERGRDRRLGGEAALQDDRGARRDVVAERGMSRQMIGGDRFRVRVVLVEPHGMRGVRAEFPQYPLHPLQDEIALAAAARSAIQRETGRPRHRFRDAALEIERLMPGQKDPLPGLHRIGVLDRRSQQLDRFHLDTSHLSLPLR